MRLCVQSIVPNPRDTCKDGESGVVLRIGCPLKRCGHDGPKRTSCPNVSIGNPSVCNSKESNRTTAKGGESCHDYLECAKSEPLRKSSYTITSLTELFLRQFQGQFPEPFAGCRVNRIGDDGSKRRYSRFSHSSQRFSAFDDVNFDLGHLIN